MKDAIPIADSWRPLFRANWTQFIFFHYSVPNADLAPFTPMEPDCRDGQAFASLVFFKLDGMRLARLLPAPLGRFLFHPVSDSWFLNVRTYVRGVAGPGIQFMVEWMDNPISLFIGPKLYGLPYRKGQFLRREEGQGGRIDLQVTDAETKGVFRASVSRNANGPKTPDHESLHEFLLEKYVAYTHHKDVTRYFRIKHPNWRVARPTVLEVDDGLIRDQCPWFARARLLDAHTSEGFGDVAMGPPRRTGEGAQLGLLTPAVNPE